MFVDHPLDFEELFAAAEPMPLGGSEVRVASVAHLVRMKRAAGRPQDLADVAALEELAGLGDV